MGWGLGDILKDTVKTVGSFIPGVGDAYAQEQANKTNIKIADNANAWMERMSNTAYQRQAEDMEKAGINRILGFQNSGASTPTASVAKVEAKAPTDLIRQGVSAFTGIQSANAQVQQAQTAAAQQQSQATLNAATTAKTAQETQESVARTSKTIDSIKNQEEARKLMRQQHETNKLKENVMGTANKGLTLFDDFMDKTLNNSAGSHRKWSSAMDAQSQKMQKQQNPYEGSQAQQDRQKFLNKGKKK